MSSCTMKRKYVYLLQMLGVCIIIYFLPWIAVQIIRYNAIRYIYSRYSEKIYLANLTTSEMMSELNTRPLYEISSRCSSKVYLLVLVTSSPQNIERRNVIRTSWARAFRKQTRLLKSSKSFQGNETFSI